MDIMADDHRYERDIPAESADDARDPSSRSASATCTLCRMPLLLEDALLVEDRALLCQQCVSAIQDALTQSDRPSASLDVEP